jgi:uncharacterized RDD family membrane protein YckC
MTESTPEIRSAGVLRRLAALVYDSFLIFGLMVVPLFLLTGLIEHGSPATPHTDAVVHALPLVAPKLVVLLYEVAVVLGFYCYFWLRNGQTLGMQAWRLRLDAGEQEGRRPTLKQCLLRALVGLASLLCAGCGYWWIWLDRERRAWHDRASGTRVIVLPKRPR